MESVEMEIESLYISNQVEIAEPGFLSQPASYKDAQVWKDIEAETGFTSYEDYLWFYKDVRRDIDQTLWELRESADKIPTYHPVRPQIVIYDLSIQENSSARLTLRCQCESGTELIQALRKPSDGVCVQLVIWRRIDSTLDQEMVDTLGLGLRLNLNDFYYREHYLPPPRKSRPQIKSIFGEQTVATICQGFMRDVANEVPVVLVTSTSEGRYWDLLGSSFVAGYCETPPFCKSPRVIMPLERKVRDHWSIERVGRDYARAVQNFIVQGRDVQPTKLSLLLAALSPLLYAAVRRITEIFNTVQYRYTNIVFADHEERETESLDTHRTRLRRTIEANEDLLCQFSRCLGSEAQSDDSKQPSYVAVVAELRSIIADARRLDAEIRDFKQIQVGDLALKESHKAIELSNAQIREAKSGKFPNNMCVD